MINVLHLAVGNLYGGIETMLISLARHGRTSASVRQEFSICFEGRLAEELEALGATVHRLGPVRASHPWLVASARRRLRRLIAARNIDVAICHSGWTMALLWPAMSRAASKIFWGHNDWSNSDWLQRLALRRQPRTIVANSSFTAASLKAAFPRAEVEIIHYPVETERAALTQVARADLRHALNTSETETVVLQISRMQGWKGHGNHLRALSLLKTLPGWKCWLVGGAQNRSEERYVEELRQLAAELGIAERVIFAGQRTDIRQLIAASDIFCQPNSGPEPFGIVFAEALFGGLPVITTAMGGVTDLVDGSCGILVPPNDVAAMADALKSLIADPLWRGQLGAAGPRRAQLITDPERQVKRLEKFVQSGMPQIPSSIRQPH